MSWPRHCSIGTYCAQPSLTTALALCAIVVDANAKTIIVVRLSAITTLIGTIDGDKNYYLAFSAEAAKFNDFLPTVQKMINSFELER